MKSLLKIICLLTLLVGQALQADDSQPLYVEINQLPTYNSVNNQTQAESLIYLYQIQWRIPARFTRANIPFIKLPKDCRKPDQFNRKAGNQGATSQAVQQRLYRCDTSLSGRGVEIAFSSYNPATSTLIKYRANNGEQHTRLLKPNENNWSIPDAETPSRIAWDYTVLGVQHILAGFDHLLFLLCLLLVAGSWKRVLITITGFTVAHSLTLVLSALEWVRLPLPPVEAVIALSIIFLATEIIKDNRETLTWRYPVAVSSSFGLLHGFGFAAALADIGLPQTELVTGLLFFNVGVEVGQVLFASAVLILLFLFQRYSIARYLERFPVRLFSSYAIGGLAAFWFIERVSGFVA